MLLIQALYPFWIGIIFNLALSMFNMIGMSIRMRGPFVEWYLNHNGGIVIMVSVWVFLILWSAFNVLTHI